MNDYSDYYLRMDWMKKIIGLLIGLGVMLHAHFLTFLPSSDIISDKKDATVHFDISFIHPFEQTGMTLEKPKLFVNSKSNVLPLQKGQKFGHKAWKSSYSIKRPATYQFFVEPTPYFEPAEEKFIVHVPKVIISAFGMEEGWDEPIGLKYEIVPLVKPFGLYAGNLFQAKVLHNGKVAANVEVEVELYNTYGLKAPSDAHITQVVKTDANGIFSFVMNHKGWWGFAALIEEGELEREGKKYPIENGALLWVKAY
jgi:cobalt/nickel transport protein